MTTKIKTKLFFAFGLFLLLLIAITFFTLQTFAESNERISVAVESSSRKVELTQDLKEGILNVAREEKDILLQTEPEQQARIQGRLTGLISKAEEKTIELQGLTHERGERILEEFKESWINYQDNLQEVISLSLAGQNQQALQLSKNAEHLRVEAMDHLDELTQNIRNDIYSEKLASDQSFNAAIASITTLVLLSILLAVLFSLGIVRSINRRISTIARKAEKIASREHSDEKLEQTIDDEMNPIVRSLININESFREVTENANLIASGEYDMKLEPRSDQDVLGNALKKMATSLRRTTAANQKHSWITSGLNRFNDKLMGNQDIEELTDNIISFLANYLNAGIGALYLVNEQESHLELKGQYAFSAPDKAMQKFPLSEGLVGQAAREKRTLSLTNVPPSHLRITSSVVEAQPDHLTIIPFTFEEKVLGVIEIGKFEDFDQKEKEFLEASVENIALAVHSAIARKKIQELLSETQVQSEELQSQQEELRQMNEELEEQTQNLKQQQEELQMTNEELEEQTQSLEAKNKEIEAAKNAVEQKTKQLETSSKYKSEFLANMSHELRTPLNSLLILSKDLSDNKNKNLDEDQVESAEIIYKSGHDLLVLINEVLDLSRVEAGKMTINVEQVNLMEFIHNLLKLFRYQAVQKNLELNTHFGEDLPEFIQTDPQRLNQILKNLLSNALKFTEEGSITLSVTREGDSSLKISVKDTGIGIKEEKQMAVFEAFQQADGGTARKYGGTGLGLSISREIAKLLEAEIMLESKPDEGSDFSIILPVEMEKSAGEPSPLPKKPVVTRSLADNKQFLNYPGIEDDRENLKETDKVVLIIEDDLQFARILKKQANQKSFKALAAATGEDGLQMALKYKPNAIILDIELPGMNGREVLSRIKADPEIRHIPVHMVSVDERTLDPIREGAVEYLVKPVDKKDLENAFNRIEDFVERKMKNLLIIEDDPDSRTAIRKLIGNGDVRCLEAGSGKEALDKYENNAVDCIVLDLGLPDMSGFDLIYRMEQEYERVPPIIIYTGKELDREENEELEKYADSIIIKGVKSEERLLDETALFLHRTIRNLPEQKQQIITKLYDKDSIFSAKRILVVDDDMRNVFALSKILKERGMKVTKADNGKSALEALAGQKDFDLVLMDIMMPEMDGYEAMRKIREQQKFRNLPIIALTAKAMKEDKQKCIDAGANDYVTKPVDVPRLLSLMQVWLSK